MHCVELKVTLALDFCVALVTLLVAGSTAGGNEMQSGNYCLRDLRAQMPGVAGFAIWQILPAPETLE